MSFFMYICLRPAHKIKKEIKRDSTKLLKAQRAEVIKDNYNVCVEENFLSYFVLNFFCYSKSQLFILSF